MFCLVRFIRRLGVIMSGFHAQETRKIMTSIDEFFGNFLKSEYFAKGEEMNLTVKEVKIERVGREDDIENKIVIYFSGLRADLASKGLGLNKVNAEAMAEITGTKTIEQWVGARVCLYVDPNVMFGGKRVGGVRVKAVLPSPVASQAVVV